MNNHKYFLATVAILLLLYVFVLVAYGDFKDTIPGLELILGVFCAVVSCLIMRGMYNLALKKYNYYDLEKIASSVDALILTVDNSLNIKYLNKKSHKILANHGVPLKNILGHNLLDTIQNESERRRTKYILQKIITSGMPETWSKQYTFNGHTAFWEMKGYPIVHGVAIIAYEITETRNKFLYLKKRDQLKKAALRGIDEVILRINRTGLIEDIFIPKDNQISFIPDKSFISFAYQVVLPSKLVSYVENALEARPDKYIEPFIFDVAGFSQGTQHYRAKATSNKDSYILLFITNITEQIRQREAQHRSDKKFDQLVSSAVCGIVIANSHGRVTYTNEVFRQTFGLSASECADLKIADIFDKGNAALSKVWTAINNYQRGTADLTATKKNGESIWVNVNYSSLISNSGTETDTILFIKDISHYKIIESELAKQTILLDAIMNNSQSLIYIKDLDGRYVKISKLISVYFNLSSEDQILGKTEKELSQGPHVDEHARNDSLAISTRKPLYTEESSIINNEKKTFLASRFPLIDASGVVYGLCGISLDITKQKEKQVEESELFRNYEQNSLLLDAILRNMHGLIYAKDLNKKYTLVNDKTVELFGKNNRSEVLGHNLMELLDSEFGRQHDKNDDIVLTTQDTISCKEQIEIAGKIQTYFSTKFPLYDLDNKLKGICGISIDITSLKDVENALEAAHTELQKFNFASDKFLSILSHDLRAPLYNFRDLSMMLLDEYSDFTEEERLEYINGLYVSSESICNLLDSLLKWGRLQQQKKLQFTISTNEITKTVDQVFEVMTPLAVRKGIELKNHIPATLTAEYDEVYIATVLRNIFSNAIKFTEDNGEIVISIKPNDLIVDNKPYILSVSDTGVGMKAETAISLLNSANQFTTNGTKGEQGSGFGLTLCKDLLEANGSKIWVKSEKGVGTTFYFTL